MVMVMMMVMEAVMAVEGRSRDRRAREGCVRARIGPRNPSTLSAVNKGLGRLGGLG